MCPIHGKIDASGSIAAAGLEIISLNSEISCPLCGRAAAIPDGRYDFRDWVVEQVAEKNFSRQQIRRFAQKAKKAKNAENFVATANTIDPVLGEIAQQAKNERKWGLNWESALIQAAAVVTILAGADGAIRNGKHAAEWVHQRWEQKFNSKSEIHDKPIEERSSENGQQTDQADTDPGRDRDERRPDAWEGIVDT